MSNKPFRVVPFNPSFDRNTFKADLIGIRLDIPRTYFQVFLFRQFIQFFIHRND